MGLLFPGALIRRERIRRNWSQEGLCKGICAVSYLSKIEQGKTEASPELLHLLFARLELPWHDDEATMEMAKSLTERCYEAVFACEKEALALLREEFAEQEERIFYSPYALDGMLLHGFFQNHMNRRRKNWSPFVTSGSWLCSGSCRGGIRRQCACIPVPASA